MSYTVLYTFIVGCSIILTLTKPRYGFLFLIFLMPLSHQGVMMGLAGYEYPHLLPLFITVATFTTAVIVYFQDIHLLITTIRSNLRIILPFVSFFGIAGITNYSINGFSYSVVLLDLFVGPISFFVLSCAFLQRYPFLIRPSLKIIIIIAIIGFFYGCFEYKTGSNPILQEYLNQVYLKMGVSPPPSSLNTPGVRVSSFFGHWLFASIIYLSSMVLTFMFIRKWQGFFLGLLFYLGVLMTQSRVGILLGLVIFAYYILIVLPKSNLQDGKAFKMIRYAIVGIPLILMFVIPLLKSPLYESITNRFVSASVEERIMGLRAFEMATLVGHGADASNRISKRLGSESGLENPWAYLAYDYGIIALIFYCTALAFVFLPDRRLAYKAYMTFDVKHLKVFFFIIIIAGSSFSSFGNRGNINYVIWFFASLVRTYGVIEQQYLKKNLLTKKASIYTK